MHQEKVNTKRYIGLLITVMIIGILAGAFVLDVIRKAVESSNDQFANNAKITQANTEIASLGSALSIYEITIGQFPTGDQGLRVLIENPGVKSWKKPFIQRRDFEDPWGNEYRYVSPGTNGKDYDLYSIGPDGQEDTGDDIGNSF